MLKPACTVSAATASAQPPSGGCVLKQEKGRGRGQLLQQPPSGGCVLKPVFPDFVAGDLGQPPSGGCVLKQALPYFAKSWKEQPPSGGCVLKLRGSSRADGSPGSRLRAAVC